MHQAIPRRTGRTTVLEALVDNCNVQSELGLDADLKSILDPNKKDVPALGLGISQPLLGILLLQRLQKCRTEIGPHCETIAYFCAFAAPPSPNRLLTSGFTIFADFRTHQSSRKASFRRLNGPKLWAELSKNGAGGTLDDRASYYQAALRALETLLLRVAH